MPRGFARKGAKGGRSCEAPKSDDSHPMLCQDDDAAASHEYDLADNPDTLIEPEMIGSQMGVWVFHSRCDVWVFNSMEITYGMVGHYLGEFRIPYETARHGQPGTSATSSPTFEENVCAALEENVCAALEENVCTDRRTKYAKDHETADTSGRKVGVTVFKKTRECSAQFGG